MTAPDPIVETVYTVARGTTAIASYRTVESDAYVDLYRIQEAMRTAGLEPDVTVATVTKTTTYGEPTPADAAAS